MGPVLKLVSGNTKKPSIRTPPSQDPKNRTTWIARWGVSAQKSIEDAVYREAEKIANLCEASQLSFFYSMFNPSHLQVGAYGTNRSLLQKSFSPFDTLYIRPKSIV
jgi:hypothetical protein